MKTLTMTITTITETDYDGIAETVKQVTGNIYDDTTQTYDLVDNIETISCDSNTTDADAKTLFKNYLLTKSYTWDNEA